MGAARFLLCLGLILISLPSLAVNLTECSLPNNLYYWDLLMDARRHRRVAFDKIDDEQRELDMLKRLYLPLIKLANTGGIAFRKFKEAEKNYRVGQMRLREVELRYEEAKARERIAEFNARCLTKRTEGIELLETYAELWVVRTSLLQQQEEEAVYQFRYEGEYLGAIQKAATSGALAPKTRHRARHPDETRRGQTDDGER